MEGRRTDCSEYVVNNNFSTILINKNHLDWRLSFKI